MSSGFEIIVPATEPASEWVRGRALQKVSPGRSHAILQRALATVLDRWGSGRGITGTEWDFRVTPPGERTRPLVPDVAFVSFARLEATGNADTEYPRMAPDAVFEIRSPGDRQLDIDDKIATYLRAGAALIAVVDPQRRTLAWFAAGGSGEVHEGERFTHAALPGFTLDLALLFAQLDVRG